MYPTNFYAIINTQNRYKAKLFETLNYYIDLRWIEYILPMPFTEANDDGMCGYWIYLVPDGSEMESMHELSEVLLDQGIPHDAITSWNESDVFETGCYRFDDEGQRGYCSIEHLDEQEYVDVVMDMSPEYLLDFIEVRIAETTLKTYDDQVDNFKVYKVNKSLDLLDPYKEIPRA